MRNKSGYTHQVPFKNLTNVGPRNAFLRKLILAIDR